MFQLKRLAVRETVHVHSRDGDVQDTSFPKVLRNNLIVSNDCLKKTVVQTSVAIPRNVNVAENVLRKIYTRQCSGEFDKRDVCVRPHDDSFRSKFIPKFTTKRVSVLPPVNGHVKRLTNSNECESVNIHTKLSNKNKEMATTKAVIKINAKNMGQIHEENGNDKLLLNHKNNRFQLHKDSTEFHSSRQNLIQLTDLIDPMQLNNEISIDQDLKFLANLDEPIEMGVANEISIDNDLVELIEPQQFKLSAVKINDVPIENVPNENSIEHNREDKSESSKDSNMSDSTENNSIDQVASVPISPNAINESLVENSNSSKNASEDSTNDISIEQDSSQGLREMKEALMLDDTNPLLAREDSSEAARDMADVFMPMLDNITPLSIQKSGTLDNEHTSNDRRNVITRKVRLYNTAEQSLATVSRIVNSVMCKAANESSSKSITAVNNVELVANKLKIKNVSDVHKDHSIATGLSVGEYKSIYANRDSTVKFASNIPPGVFLSSQPTVRDEKSDRNHIRRHHKHCTTILDPLAIDNFKFSLHPSLERKYKIITTSVEPRISDSTEHVNSPKLKTIEAFDRLKSKPPTAPNTETFENVFKSNDTSANVDNIGSEFKTNVNDTIFFKRIVPRVKTMYEAEDSANDEYVDNNNDLNTVDENTRNSTESQSSNDDKAVVLLKDDDK